MRSRAGITRRWLAFALAIGVVSSLFATGPAHAARPVYTDQELAALPAEKLAALLNPLRELASALSQQGESAWSDVYSGLSIDAGTGVVRLYLTDPARADGFLRGLANGHLVEVRASRYPARALEAARERLYASAASLPFAVHSWAVPADGSGLQLGVSDPATAARSLTSATASGRSALDTAGVHIGLTAAAPNGGGTRADDPPPIYGGSLANIYNSSGGLKGSCTSGIPARERLGTRRFSIFSAHCAVVGDTVKSGAGRYWGRVTNRSPQYDAALIEVGNLPYIWDGPNTNSFLQRLHNTSSSWNGDWVCHDGYVSGVVCSIKVVNDNVSWTIPQLPGVLITGVEGTQTTGLRAMRCGDSGGVVFAIAETSTRQLRGVASTLKGTTNCGFTSGIYWTEPWWVPGLWDLVLNE